MEKMLRSKFGTQLVRKDLEQLHKLTIEEPKVLF